MILYLRIMIIDERGINNEIEKIWIGLLMFAGVVAIFVAMPKQANAASDGNVSEQYATAVISE